MTKYLWADDVYNEPYTFCTSSLCANENKFRCTLRWPTFRIINGKGYKFDPYTRTLQKIWIIPKKSVEISHMIRHTLAQLCGTKTPNRTALSKPYKAKILESVQNWKIKHVSFKKKIDLTRLGCKTRQKCNAAITTRKRSNWRRFWIDNWSFISALILFLTRFWKGANGSMIIVRSRRRRGSWVRFFFSSFRSEFLGGRMCKCIHNNACLLLCRTAPINYGKTADLRCSNVRDFV